MVYCISCLANEQDIDIPHIDLEQSISLGQFLRDSFTRNRSFEEIYNQVSQPSSDRLKKTKSTEKASKHDELPVSIRQETTKVTPKTAQPPEKEVSKIIEKITEGVDVINDSEASIVVIGKTGVGKSTLVNYLTNPDKLEVKIYKKPGAIGKGVPVIDLKDNDLTLPKPGHSKDAQTTVPQSWNDNGITYWDCPGFEDNTGYVQDVANAFYIK